MLEIRNWNVWGLERSLIASGNPMTIGEINTGPEPNIGEFFIEPDGPETKRGKRLGSSPVGSAHDHFLLGVHVQFDIKFPQYWTIESERYHNFEIISSQSKMHKLTMMGKDENFETMFNKYVDKDIILKVKGFIEEYNAYMRRPLETSTYRGVAYIPKEYIEASYPLFMKCVSNLPMGFEMWETCDLTYLQLKTIYFQRRNHKLKEDWGNFCDWCESLPMFKELIIKE